MDGLSYALCAFGQANSKRTLPYAVRLAFEVCIFLRVVLLEDFFIAFPDNLKPDGPFIVVGSVVAVHGIKTSLTVLSFQPIQIISVCLSLSLEIFKVNLHLA